MSLTSHSSKIRLLVGFKDNQDFYVSLYFSNDGDTLEDFHLLCKYFKHKPVYISNYEGLLADTLFIEKNRTKLERIFMHTLNLSTCALCTDGRLLVLDP